MEEQLRRQKDELSGDKPTTAFVDGILEVVQEGVRLDHEQYAFFSPLFLTLMFI